MPAFPQRRAFLFRVVLFALVGLFFGSGTMALASDPEPNCAIQEGACTLSAGNRTVTLNIQPKPVQAMQELTFRVEVSGEPPSSPPVIDLDMPGMEMGPNQVRLRPVKATVFEGTGVIVRCPSGKRLWSATVILSETTKAKFLFRVRY
ncbi:MAG: hypothetical protein V5B78_04980 [Desulfohalobiaceae bacterium]